MTNGIDLSFNPQQKGFSLAGSKPMSNISRVAQDPTAGFATGREFLNPVKGAGEMDLSLAGGDMNLGPGAGSSMDWGGAMDMFSTGAQGVLGLANAYNAYKQMKLMEDQFDFAKADRNQQVANQAAITNEALKSQQSAKAQLSGAQYGTPEYNKQMENAVQVSGAPV